VCVCVCIYIYVFIYLCIYICIYLYIHIYTYIYIYIHIYMYIYVCVYIYIYIYIYTYIYIYIRFCSLAGLIGPASASLVVIYSSIHPSIDLATPAGWGVRPTCGSWRSTTRRVADPFQTASSGPSRRLAGHCRRQCKMSGQTVFQGRPFPVRGYI